MHMHFKTEAEKKAYQDAVKKTSVFLARLSSLLRSKRFRAWYCEEKSRFDWAGERLFAKLRKDLAYQLAQAVGPGELKTHDFVLLEMNADLLDAAVHSLETQHEIKNTKTEKSFRIPRDADVSELVFGFLGRFNREGMLREIPHGFYIWNSIFSLRTFVQARETLIRSTGNPVFEKVLSGLTEDYLVNGYPHDLLAFDAQDVRDGVKLKALLVRSEYCSSASIKQDEELYRAEGFQTIHFNKAA